MRPTSVATRVGATLGPLAILMALLVLPALHPVHVTGAAKQAPALTAPGQPMSVANGECPLCCGLARVRSAPAGAGPGLRVAADLDLERAALEVTLPHAPARNVSRARAPPAPA